MTLKPRNRYGSRVFSPMDGLPFGNQSHGLLEHPWKSIEFVGFPVFETSGSSTERFRGKKSPLGEWPPAICPARFLLACCSARPADAAPTLWGSRTGRTSWDFEQMGEEWIRMIMTKWIGSAWSYWMNWRCHTLKEQWENARNIRCLRLTSASVNHGS